MTSEENKIAKEVIMSISKLDINRKNELIELSYEIIDLISKRCKSIEKGGLSERAFLVETLREEFWSSL